MPEAASLGALHGIVGYHLMRASATVAADFSKTMQGTGMRQVLIAILLIIEANPGRNQGHIGKLLGIQRPNMVTLINELVERGLITREISAHNRRAFEIRLSAEGAALLVLSMKRIEVHEARLLDGLSDREQAQLIALLMRIGMSKPDR